MTKGLTSVDNALRLLLLLGEQESVRISQAAKYLGVSRSTAHRLLTTLKEHGFAEQDKPNGPYQTGAALWEHGARAMSRVDLKTISRPHIMNLAQQIGETCHLTVLEGNSVRFVDGIEGSRPGHIALRIGLVISAHATAAGKAILAAMPVESVRALYPRGVHSLTDNTLKSMTEIENQLSEIARTGVATNFNESLQDFAALAVVIRGSIGEPIGALTLGIPPERLPQSRIPVVVRRMQRASLAISDSIASPTTLT